MEAEISLAKMFDDPVLHSYKMHVQGWPRDIDLKKGLLSGLWKDLKTVVSAKKSRKFMLSCSWKDFLR